MKRKDTKKYKELVDDYCESRMSLESNKETVEEMKENLKKEQEAFDNLPNKDNEHIKCWFEIYTATTMMSVGSLTNMIETVKERINEKGKIIEKDYEEDLDQLYNEWKRELYIP